MSKTLSQKKSSFSEEADEYLTQLYLKNNAQNVAEKISLLISILHIDEVNFHGTRLAYPEETGFHIRSDEVSQETQIVCLELELLLKLGMTTVQFC